MSDDDDVDITHWQRIIWKLFSLISSFVFVVVSPVDEYREKISRNRSDRPSDAKERFSIVFNSNANSITYYYGAAAGQHANDY